MDAPLPTASQPVECATDCGLTEPWDGNYFVAAYPPFSVWSSAQASTVKTVLSAPAPRHPAPLGLYVHVPFCVKRCDYCYYLSYDDKSPAHHEAYLHALLQEIALYERAPALTGRRIRFLYIGGGTPTLLAAAHLKSLLHRIGRAFMMHAVDEATCECAPLTASPEKLCILRDAGITRISLGVQSMDDDVLRRNGRVHLRHDVERAYARIRDHRFPIVNLDLIVGLLGDTDKTFEQTVDRVIELAPDSVTIYQLELPPTTRMQKALRHDVSADPPPDWNLKRARLAYGFERLERAGYTVRSAYAAVRDPERHSFVYQDAQYAGADVVGLGVSSFSYLCGVHYQNRTSFDAYLADTALGRLPVERAYTLTDDDRLVREFILQLKLGRIDRGAFRRKFHVDPAARFAAPLAEFGSAGWIAVTDDEIVLTRPGLLRVDRLLPAFYRTEHAGVRYA